MLLHLVAESFYLSDACSVFLCSDDKFGCGHLREHPVDFIYVVGCEVVVIAEGEWGDMLCERLQVDEHLLG